MISKKENAQHATAPIGFFDSGIGGLSVMLAARRILPLENLIYFADSAHCPYGSKGGDFVRQRSLAISRFLLEQGAKAIVVACNSASEAALELLRLTFPGLGDHRRRTGAESGPGPEQKQKNRRPGHAIDLEGTALFPAAGKFFGRHGSLHPAGIRPGGAD